MEAAAILVGNRAVEPEQKHPPVADARAANAGKKTALLAANNDLERLKSQLASKIIDRGKLSLQYNTTVIEGGATDLDGGNVQPAVKRYTETAALIAITNEAIAQLHFIRIPNATIRVMELENEVKETAATAIDAERWARHEKHSAALDAMAEEEGAVEIRPARFEAEGVIATRFREEAVVIRRGLRDFIANANKLRNEARDSGLLKG